MDLSTAEAARMLGITPNTLRHWEVRYAFPTAARDRGPRARFDLGEVRALRDALRTSHSVTHAMRTAMAAPERLMLVAA